MTSHIRIVNDPIEMVSLFVTFNNDQYKEIYEHLTRAWMTEEELAKLAGHDSVGECLAILKKGNLIEEKWRTPPPGKKPVKEYRTIYSRFRANFQCNMTDLGDLIHVALSNDEKVRDLVDQIEEEIKQGNTSINDIARKYNVSQVVIKGLAKRIPRLDVKGQGMVLVDHGKR